MVKLPKYLFVLVMLCALVNIVCAAYAVQEIKYLRDRQIQFEFEISKLQRQMYQVYDYLGKRGYFIDEEAGH